MVQATTGDTFRQLQHLFRTVCFDTAIRRSTQAKWWPFTCESVHEERTTPSEQQWMRLWCYLNIPYIPTYFLAYSQTETETMKGPVVVLDVCCRKPPPWQARRPPHGTLFVLSSPLSEERSSQTGADHCQALDASSLVPWNSSPLLLSSTAGARPWKF